MGRRARWRWRPSGKVLAMSDRAVGEATAAPAPCSARAATSQAWSVAKPPANEATVKTAMPTTNMRRRPKTSPLRPPSSSRPPKLKA